ncbi:MAG: aspartyl/asparaginyl beta-hydroxylase domain-containing protein [Flavobacteriales bacterium]|nr:aspartyl/asparaginyl beta-hydroxylase domain-containing protein [Flavobacteriales bacterium]
MSLQEPQKIWFSFLSPPLTDNDQHFFDKNELAWVRLLEANWEQIKTEVGNYLLENKEIKPYFNPNLTANSTQWKSFAFVVWGWKKRINIKKCPNTYKLLQQVEGLVSASISILEPETRILPHVGDTNAIYRCHLGLVIPQGLPVCGIEVGGVQRSWEEGKILVFDDAQRHRAWNDSKETRVVMIIDVMRQAYAHRKYSVCATILSKLSMQGMLNRFPFLKKLPKRTVLNNVLKFMAWMINPILRLRGA